MVGSATFLEIVDPNGSWEMHQMRHTTNINRESCPRWDGQSVYSKFGPLNVIFLPGLEGQEKPQIKRISKCRRSRSFDENPLTNGDSASLFSEGFMDVNESFYK